jgi:beta-N-acetylhexosaminidase
MGMLATPPTEITQASPSPTVKPVTKDDIAQLMAVPLTITNGQVSSGSGAMEFIGEYKPGFVTIFGENIASKSATNVIESIRNIAEPMPLIAVDHEGGKVQRLSGTGFTKLPSLKEICTKDSLQRTQLFAQSALELQKVGVDIVYAPVVDLTASGSALRDRTCSNDPVTTAAVAQEMIVEFRQKGLLPVIKHYPGIGATKRDLHDSLDAVLTEPKELPVFASLFRIFPRVGVMTTHVLVKDMSEEAPCSLNQRCINQLKKDAPQVLIFSDALDMESARTGFDLLSKKTLIQVSREALLAGNHVLVYGKDTKIEDIEKILQSLWEEYEANELMRMKIDAALQQVRSTRTEVLEK